MVYMTYISYTEKKKCSRTFLQHKQRSFQQNCRLIRDSSAVSSQRPPCWSLIYILNIQIYWYIYWTDKYNFLLDFSVIFLDMLIIFLDLLVTVFGLVGDIFWICWEKIFNFFLYLDNIFWISWQHYLDFSRFFFGFLTTFFGFLRFFLDFLTIFFMDFLTTSLCSLPAQLDKDKGIHSQHISPCCKRVWRRGPENFSVKNQERHEGKFLEAAFHILSLQE